MNRELIHESNSELVTIVSVSVEEDVDAIVFKAEDELGSIVKLALDFVSANGFRIAFSSLQDVPPLILPKSILGDYHCHYLRIEYTKDDLVFEKENGNTEPLGKYMDIDDGMICFNRDEVLWIGFSTKENIICTLDADKEYLVLKISKDILEILRETMDFIFPFNRFGKDNKLSYGYFHSIKEEE